MTADSSYNLEQGSRGERDPEIMMQYMLLPFFIYFAFIMLFASWPFSSGRSLAGCDGVQSFFQVTNVISFYCTSSILKKGRGPVPNTGIHHYRVTCPLFLLHRVSSEAPGCPCVVGIR